MPIQYMTEKLKLPLILVMVVAISLMILAFIYMLEPYNYIVCLALAGPLSAAIMGFKNWKRTIPATK